VKVLHASVRQNVLLCVCVFLEKAALGEDFQDSGERFGRSSQS